MSGTVRRTLISADPFSGLDAGRNWGDRGNWPARWVACADQGEPPFVCAYRLTVTLRKAVRTRIHVTADERYELFLDGERVGRGSERGDQANWFYESWDLALSAGRHVLVARVWSQGDQAAYAQLSAHPGFLLAGEGRFHETFSTGTARWTAKRLGGYGFRSSEDAWGTGWNLDVDGSTFDWGFKTGGGGGWKPVRVLSPGVNGALKNEIERNHMLKPATLPPQLEVRRAVGVVRHVEAVRTLATRGLPVRGVAHLESEAAPWRGLLAGTGRVTVPPRTRRRVIIDLADYYCGYPELTVSKGRGAVIRVLWEEGLYQAGSPREWARARPKGNRNEIEGKFMIGVGDVFRPDGGGHRTFETLWWQAGRYVEVAVETGAQPLVLERWTLRETRYPLELQSRFAASDHRLARTIPVMVRALQMCSHETYMDCPYYEQLMYVGDTRLEVLATYVAHRDDRLPRKALRLFDQSRLPAGFTQSRYPSRIQQIIPPFSLWWIGMVHDFALWRGDRSFVKTLMPGVRAVTDAFAACRNRDGLVEAPNGWNYMDWVPGWRDGIPPDGDRGVSGVINWQFALILTRVAELEAWVGEQELAVRAYRMAEDLGKASSKAFWEPRRGMLADDLGRKHFSEHAQCLALLSRQVPAAMRRRIAYGLLTDPDLARTTIYFSHYLFETYRGLGRADALLDRMRLWFDLPGMGFKTTLESPEPSRSDCHAWGAHPLFHYFATILGIRPAGLGSPELVIAPLLGPLEWASGTLAHPLGDVTVDLRRDGRALTGRVVLPRGLRATLRHAGAARRLGPGRHEVRIG